MSHNTINKGYTYIILAGEGARVFWFFFVSLEGTKYGKGIPRFTKEDEALLVEKHRNDKLNEYLTFGQLYDNRIVATLTTIEEYVFEKWHFQRILTVGDSCHKVLIS